MLMLLWKPCLNHHAAQRDKWLSIAQQLQATERGSHRERAAWRTFSRHDRWLYHFYHRKWLRHIKREMRQWHPYSAFYHLPQLVMDMVDRCYEYWTLGYNVHVAPEGTAPILEQVVYAHELANACRIVEAETGSFPTEKIIELFTYIAQHVEEWGD